MSDRPARIVALSPRVVADRSTELLRDLESALDPDLVCLPGPTRNSAAVAGARRAFDATVVHPPIETGSGDAPFRPVDVGDRRLFVSQGIRSLAADPDAVDRTLRETAATGSALVCDDIATTVRPTSLSTTLDHAETLAAALPTGAVTTLLTGGLPAGYDERWILDPETGDVVEVDHAPEIGADERGDHPGDGAVGVRVRGAGPVEGYGADDSIVALEFGPAGVEVAGTYGPADFGLEAISGIGAKTAARLAERGITTREALLETPIRSLAELPGVGRTSAETMRRHARVLESGEPLLCTDDSPPGAGWDRPPLCLDIETDGLSPTIIWQIGVFDPETDEYRAFVERSDPTDPGSVIEAFCDWLLGVHPDRALLTWNGWGFDYRHLTAFVERHVDYYADEWDAVPKLDLYLWAVTDGNALLPGRTNRLEDVAGALGYEFADTGLDGETTAAAYQRFARTGTELDWDRHERYCEDDCRALWHVFERLRDAARAGETGTVDDAEAGVGADADTGTSADAGAGETRSGTSGETVGPGTGPASERTSASSGSNRTASGPSEQAGLGDFS